MVSIKDISKECGYSSATVSKALNGGSDIGQETAKNIRSIAKRMGYYPNAAARALKTNRTFNLGVLFMDNTASGLTHEYFSALLNSFKVEVEQSGYDLTFISNQVSRFTTNYLDHCRYRQCDGVMIACFDFSNPDVMSLIQSEIPTVTIDFIYDHHTSIISDNFQGMNELIKYVYGKGHRKIAFVHGEDTAVTKTRLEGFYQTCRDLGIDVPNEYVKPALYHDPKSSGQATHELLSLPERPTCILYPDDFSYIGGMNEIERMGFSIPDDISVVGYDGIYLSQVLRPRLTTLHQDTDTLGKEAAAELIKAIQKPKSYIPQQIVVKGKILEGDSVKQL
ncbi:MAG: LacI family DNA-binding transcriptional regulator [Flexilinea sp.]|jgi:LacI family transcriptional regulator